MWLKFALCLLVGVAYASNNPGWKPHTEYTYKIQGHTLARLDGISNQNSGIFLKGNLIIRTNTNNLIGKLNDVKFAQVHANLPENLLQQQFSDDAHFKDMPLSNQPFQIHMTNGIVRNVVVEKNIPNWEANFIKSIVSQIQLDIKAENLVQSHVNTLPKEGRTSAVFKTMEDTITGQTETLYDIHQLPDERLETEPYLVPQPQLQQDGEVIEIIKNRNYTSNQFSPEYHYGMAGISSWTPSGSQIGQFFTRSSLSRVILTGNLDKYTIQSSVTVDDIVLSPSLNEVQKGSVQTILNLTLQEVVQSSNNEVEEIPNPINMGSLVYRFNNPYLTNLVREQYQSNEQRVEEDESEDSVTETSLYKRYLGRFKNLVDPIKNHFKKSSEDESVPIIQEYYQQQDLPKMESEPEYPLLPYTMGYLGNSIKINSSYDVKRNVEVLCREIGDDMKRPSKISEQDTLGKFVLLTSLIRIMNANDLQQVSNELYKLSKSESGRLSWLAFRDSVAEAGTGPAFITINDWIISKKIENEEAAAVVSTMAHAVRFPTQEYMESFYNLLKDEKVMSQHTLNDTIILSYTSLVRKVYGNKFVSRNQFPVNIFGSFRTAAGKTFVRNTLIPYLTEELNNAMKNNDIQKIHLFIRALGNVGHRNMLLAFEPYLEGRKLSSNFQRVWMIIALDKLVKIHPLVARSVLYKVYQNVGEIPEVRVAAVYQLMRTSPPTEMLQRMAEYTNTDSSDEVNSAVKTSIENFAQLKGDEFEYMRSSARAALPLLTKKEFGVQYSQNFLRSFVNEEMKIYTKETIQTLGGVDSIVPKGIKVAMRSTLGGFRHQLINIQAMTNSVEQLIQLFKEQTKSYAESKHQPNKNEKYSNEKLAEILNLQPEQREQLEGILNLEMGSMHGLLSFDKSTIERLPEFIRNQEKLLQAGRSMQLFKLVSSEEMAIAFPTELGFPFLYTYDVPTLLSLEGRIKIQSEPELSSQKQLQLPQRVSGNAEIQLMVARKSQSRLNFITPFEHQQYTAGYDKQLQVYLPLRASFDVDFHKQHVRLEVEPMRHELTDTPIFHLSSWPYTSISCIMDLKPISQREGTKRIYQKNSYSYNNMFGTKETGMTFEVRVTQEQPIGFNMMWLLQKIRENDLTTNVLSWLYGANIENRSVNIYFVPEKSCARKITVKFGCQQQYVSKTSQLHKIAEHFKGLASLKQEESVFNNVKVNTYDASVEFHGEHSVEYVWRGALGKSDIDPKSVLLMEFLKKSSKPDSKPYHISVHANNYIPNTNEIDLAYSFQQEPLMNSRVHVVFGSGDNHKLYSNIQAEIKLRRSEERKIFLMQHPLYKQCKEQFNQGEALLPACTNFTSVVNLLDQINIDLKHENLKQEVFEGVEDVYGVLRALWYPVREANVQQLRNNNLNIKASFNPALTSLDILVHTNDKLVKIEEIPINDFSRRVLVVHPVFHLPSRIMSKLLGLHTYRPVCTIGADAVNTFNNKTYWASIGKEWNTMLHYVPKVTRNNLKQSVQEELRESIENYAVLVRANLENVLQKDVKIIVKSPNTEGQLFDIELVPSSKKIVQTTATNPSAKVTVNGQQVTISKGQNYENKHGYLQIYVLPNGEVKVEIRDKFYIIYDGRNVKLTALTSRFREAIRGLCGQFNGDATTDFLTPQNYYAKNSKDFLDSYVLDVTKQSKTQQEKRETYRKQTLFANVISSRDGGRQVTRMCARYQTKYVEQNGQTCFTIQPLNVCNCADDTMTKSSLEDVPVHCVGNSNVVQMWKEQIDNGASPDFSKKPQTSVIKMRVAQGCEN